MSPCEEGMSPYLINSKKFPLEEGSKRWFWKPMSSRLPALLDKHFDRRPKYISCCVEFLNTSNENLIVDYKHMLAMARNKTGIFSYWHFIKKRRPSVRQFSISCLPNLCSAICYSGFEKFWCCWNHWRCPQFSRNQSDNLECHWRFQSALKYWI